MAYVNVRKRGWFDYQTALFGSDKILGFVTQTFQGQHAPMSFYVAAWASMVHYFAEQVRLNSCSLKDAVRNTGQWEHRWTNYVAPQKGGDNDGGAGVGSVSRSTNPDLPKEIQDEIRRLKDSVRQWQGQADHYKQKCENNKNDRGKGGGGKAGKREKDDGRQREQDAGRQRDRRDGQGGRPADFKRRLR